MLGTAKENAELAWEAIQVILATKNLPPLDEWVQEHVKMNFVHGYELGWEAAPKPKWVPNVSEERQYLMALGWVAVGADVFADGKWWRYMCPPKPPIPVTLGGRK